MKVTIKIDCGNEAFSDGNAGREVARILRQYAANIEEGIEPRVTGFYDFNGNKVGQAKVTR